MRVARQYLEQLADDARRFEREAREHDRAGHFVMAQDKRLAAVNTRARLAELEYEQQLRRASVRFG